MRIRKSVRGDREALAFLRELSNFLIAMLQAVLLASAASIAPHTAPSCQFTIPTVR